MMLSIELVSTQEFAKIMGVTRQRIHDLESARRIAPNTHPFPAPVIPGYWVRTAAELYTLTRKRKPGPAPCRRTVDRTGTAPAEYPPH